LVDFNFWKVIGLWSELLLTSQSLFNKCQKKANTNQEDSTPQSHPLQRLIENNYRGKIWLATAYSILNKIFDLAPPALIGMVDVVVKQEDSLIALGA